MAQPAQIERCNKGMADSLSFGHGSPRRHWSASCSPYCSLGMRRKGSRTGCPTFLSKFIVIGGITAFYNGFRAAIGGIILSNQSCGNNVQRTYTVEQVSQILGISLRKTYYLCEHTTDFKVIRLGKRCLRIHKESFDSWFNAINQP